MQQPVTTWIRFSRFTKSILILAWSKLLVSTPIALFTRCLKCVEKESSHAEGGKCPSLQEATSDSNGLISDNLMFTVNPASAPLFSPEIVRKRMEDGGGGGECCCCEPSDDAPCVRSGEERSPRCPRTLCEAQGSHLHPSSIRSPSRAHFIFSERSFGADMRRIAPFFFFFFFLIIRLDA